MPDLYGIIKAYGAVPKLTSFHRPMFIGPHPDDIEFGCGGLIAKLKEEGVPVVFLIATDGAAGSDDPSLTPEEVRNIREKEALKASEFLGVDKVEFCRLEDGGDYEVTDAIKAIHDEGKKVLVWTANEKKSQKHFMCTEIDGLITDNVTQAVGLVTELENRSDLDRMVDKIKTIM